MEVRCTVRDLLRLTNGEVMDVKRDDDVMNECAADGTRPDVAGAGSDADAAGDDRTLRARRGGAGVATPGDDARVLPVDPALDERVGPARLPIAKRVADVMGRPPEMESEDDVESGEISSSDVRSLAMSPAWPAPRPREDDPTAPRAIETAAEVIRVRRVARFLAFATLRPLAPLRVLESDETNGSNPNPNPDASARAGDTKRHELSLPAGTELQLIAGRTLLERRGGEASMERTLRGLRPGAVARVTGRLQANPRPLTVDVVASGVDFVQGNEAVAMLARAMPTPPAGGRGLARVDRHDRHERPARDAPRVSRRDPLVVVQEQTVGQETREEAIGDGGAGFRSGYRRALRRGRKTRDAAGASRGRARG